MPTLPQLNTRKPTGRTSYPRIALPGPGGSGRSWEIATFSASPRVGRTMWLELTERVADEYGAIPGAAFELLVHDGSYQSIITAVHAAKAHAQAAVDAGELPWVMAVDTISAFWDMLKNWAGWRARQSDSARARLRRDPSAEIKVTMNLWQDVDKRWRELMDLLLTGPWILVMLANGKEVVVMDDDGRPDPSVPKQYKIEAKGGFDNLAAQIVRMSPDAPPTIVKLRTVHNGIRPGVEAPEVPDDFSLEWLVFERLRFDHTNAAVTETVALHGGDLTEDERATEDVDDQTRPTGPGRTPRTAATASRWTRDQAQTIEQHAANWALKCLQVSDVDTAAEAATMVAAQWIGGVDMLRFLNDDVRERLGILPDIESITLAELGAMVVTYVGRHKRSPLEPIDIDTDAAAADPTTTEHPEDEPRTDTLAVAPAHETDRPTDTDPADLTSEGTHHELAHAS